MKRLIFILSFLFSLQLHSQHVVNTCEESNVITYFVSGLPNSEYIWTLSSPLPIVSDNNSSISIAFPDTNGVYTIEVQEVSEFGCQGETTKMTTEIIGCMYYYLPNSFTVNNDGLNENFKIKGLNLDVQDYSLMIFNRWGKVLFETNDPQIGWNGYYMNEKCQQGVYSYKIEFKKDSKLHQKFGQVNLLN